MGSDAACLWLAEIGEGEAETEVFSDSLVSEGLIAFSLLEVIEEEDGEKEKSIPLDFCSIGLDSLLEVEGKDKSISLDSRDTGLVGIDLGTSCSIAGEGSKVFRGTAHAPFLKDSRMPVLIMF